MDIVSKYYHKVNTIGSVIYPDEISDFLDATDYLGKVTGKEASFSTGDPIYYDLKHFKNDMNRWRNWLEKNKYIINKRKADSIINMNYKMREQNRVKIILDTAIK